jgi:DNA polymerase-1
VGKTANFSGVYNLFNAGSIHSLLEKRGIIMPRIDVEQFMADYKQLCSGLVNWMYTITNQIDQTGYVKTQFGNRRRFGIVNQDNREEAHKEGINTMAQGPACQLTWFSIIEVDKWLRETGTPAQIAMMVYDSIVLIARKDVAQAVGEKVADIMVQTAYSKLGTKVPFKADVSIGKSWGDAK